jgi:hypothetical protein
MSARMPFALAGLIVLLLPLNDALSVRHRATSSPRPAEQKGIPVTSDQAVQTVFNRTELRELSARVESLGGGQVHLGIMLDSDKPQIIEGAGYWWIGVYENHPDRSTRIANLLVRERDGQLFGQNLINEKVQPFSEWCAREKLTFTGRPEPEARPSIEPRRSTVAPSHKRTTSRQHTTTVHRRTTPTKSRVHKKPTVSGDSPRPGFLTPR